MDAKEYEEKVLTTFRKQFDMVVYEKDEVSRKGKTYKNYLLTKEDLIPVYDTARAKQRNRPSDYFKGKIDIRISFDPTTDETGNMIIREAYFNGTPGKLVVTRELGDDVFEDGFNLILSFSETDFKRTNDEFSKWHLQFHNMTDEVQFLDNKFSLIKMCKRLKSGRMPFDYLEYTHDTDFSDEIIFDKIDKFLNQAQSFIRYMKRFEKLTKIMNIGKNTEGE